MVCFGNEDGNFFVGYVKIKPTKLNDIKQNLHVYMYLIYMQKLLFEL